MGKDEKEIREMDSTSVKNTNHGNLLRCAD